MRGIDQRVVGLVGLTLLAAATATLGVAGCGSTGGGAGTGGTTGAGTGGATSAGTGGATTPGTGGATTLGTGGATTPGTGGRTGTGGAPAGTGGRTGTGGAQGTGGAGGQGGRGTLTLTSGMLTNGGTFPAANTCAGANQSPDLMWTAGPTGTLSYAIVMVDTDITRYHWAIWNMAAPTVMSLPAALPTGASITAPPVTAMQAITGTAAPMYQGPCPNGNVHTYVLTVYALDVATVPGLATGAMAQAVFTAIQSHILASGTLSGTSNAVRAP